MFQEGYGYPKTTQVVATSGASAATSNAVGAHIHCVRLVADADLHFTIAKAPTATTSHVFLAADRPEYFVIHPGEKVACIAASANLYVTEMTR